MELQGFAAGSQRMFRYHIVSHLGNINYYIDRLIIGYKINKEIHAARCKFKNSLLKVYISFSIFIDFYSKTFIEIKIV